MGKATAKLARRFSAPGIKREVMLAFFARSLGAVSLFVMNMVIARTLAPEQAGYFFLGFALVTVLAQIGVLGLEGSTLRFIGAAAAEDDWCRVIGMARLAWRWVGTVTVTLALGLWLAAPILAEQVFAKPPLVDTLRIMAPGVALAGLGILGAHQLQALRLVAQSVFVLSIGLPLGICLGVWLLPIGVAEQAAWLYTAAAAMTLVIGYVWWAGRVPAGVRGSISRDEVMRSCLPLWLTVVMSQAVNWGGQFAAGAWASADEVAFLAVAQRTANLVSFILIAVNLVLAPRFAALFRQGREAEVQRLAIKSVRAMLAVALPMLALVILIPERIMGLFGPEFEAAAPLLLVLALGQFVNVVTGSVTYLLAMAGHEKDLRNMVLFTGPFAIVLALVLTPIFGIVGAAVATACSIAVQNLIAVALVRKRLGFNTLAIWRRA